MRLVGYIRVSRVGGREGEGYISPDTQRDAIEHYARELGGALADWYTDEDFSGGNTDRPGFQTVLSLLEAGQVDGVVVMRIDRFARSVADGARIVRDIVDRGQVFAACHERIDPRTPEGRYMLTSFLANGELFLDQMKAGWWNAKRRAVARGVHIGPTPIGYRRVKSQPLELDPVAGPAVGDLFALAARQDRGDTGLARWFCDRHPPVDRRGWQASEIRRWLRNSVYLGHVKYGDLTTENAHPALTDPDTWQRAQRAARERRKGTERFVLSGKIRCAGCRYAMGGQAHAGTNLDTRVYRCPGRDCPSRSVIVAGRVEQWVMGELVDRLRLVAEGVSDDGDLAVADRALANAEQEVQAFAGDLEARRLLGEAGWREALAVRVGDRDRKRTVRDDLAARHHVTRLALEPGEHDLGDLLAAVRHIFVRRAPRGSTVGDRALIVWVDDPAALEIPGPHRSGPFDPVDW